MENETTLLQKEIERLNFIINLLIEKNRELERKLQSAFQQITSTDHPFLQHIQDGDEINNVFQYAANGQELSNGNLYNSSPGVNGMDDPAYSNAGNRDALKHSAYSNAENGEALKHSAYSNVENGQASKLSAYSNVENGQASKSAAYSNAENGEVPKQPFAPISTTEIDPAKVNYNEVYAALRMQMPNAKRTAAKNAAFMLIHLCSKKNNTHHELCKVTSLTPRGMAKHIMMLKRRGYIVRTAYQQYELTERALMILRQAIH